MSEQEKGGSMSSRGHIGMLGSIQEHTLKENVRAIISSIRKELEINDWETDANMELNVISVIDGLVNALI